LHVPRGVMGERTVTKRKGKKPLAKKKKNEVGGGRLEKKQQKTTKDTKKMKKTDRKRAYLGGDSRENR